MEIIVTVLAVLAALWIIKKAFNLFWSPKVIRWNLRKMAIDVAIPEEEASFGETNFALAGLPPSEELQWYQATARRIKTQVDTRGGIHTLRPYEAFALLHVTVKLLQLEYISKTLVWSKTGKPPDGPDPYLMRSLKDFEKQITWRVIRDGTFGIEMVRIAREDAEFKQMIGLGSR